LALLDNAELIRAEILLRSTGQKHVGFFAHLGRKGLLGERLVVLKVWVLRIEYSLATFGKMF
jgi:hypothetical protein